MPEINTRLPGSSAKYFSQNFFIPNQVRKEEMSLYISRARSKQLLFMLYILFMCVLPKDCVINKNYCEKSHPQPPPHHFLYSLPSTLKAFFLTRLNISLFLGSHCYCALSHETIFHILPQRRRKKFHFQCNHQKQLKKCEEEKSKKWKKKNIRKILL